MLKASQSASIWRVPPTLNRFETRMSMVLRPVRRKPLRVSNGARIRRAAAVDRSRCCTTPVPLSAPPLIVIVGFSGRPLSNVPVAPNLEPPQELRRVVDADDAAMTPIEGRRSLSRRRC